MSERNNHVAEPFRSIVNEFSSIVNEFSTRVPPFRKGQTVRIKGNDHLGPHRVDNCEWFDRTTNGVPHYWLCECSAIREPIDWSKIPEGATGIVVGSCWRGNATHLIRAMS